MELSFRMIRVAAAVLLPAVLLLSAGCELDDDDASQKMVVVSVHARDWQDDVSEAGVTVAILSPETNTVVAGPMLTDSEGRAVFNLSAGRYAVLAFPGDGLDLFHLPQPLTVDENIEMTILTRADSDFADEAPRLAGRITDATDGQPLDRVFVHWGIAYSSYLSAWRGIYHPGDDLSLSDGRFSSPGAVFAQDPFSGNLTQLAPLIFTRRGYLPRFYLHDFPNGDNNTDVIGLEIVMTPLSGTESAVLTGHLRCLDELVVGVLIGLSPVAGAGKADKGGVGQPAVVAVTDSAGSFRFDNLPAGTYLIHPSYLPDDGYSYVDSSTPVTLISGEEVDAGRQRVIFSIEPVFPLPETAVAEVATLSWRSVAAADSYRVYLNRAFLGVTADTTRSVPADLLPGPGWHRWWVEAFDTIGRDVAAPENILRFQVQTPTDRRAAFQVENRGASGAAGHR